MSNKTQGYYQENAGSDETWWLIESTFKGLCPMWWDGVPQGSGQSFSSDPNKAIRFKRKQDAERVASFMHMTKVTEHMFLDMPRPPECLQAEQLVTQLKGESK